MNTKPNQGPESPADLEWSQGAKNPRMQSQNIENDSGTLSSDTTNQNRGTGETPGSEICATGNSSSGPIAGDTAVENVLNLWSLSKKRRKKLRKRLSSGLQQGILGKADLNLKEVAMDKLKPLLEPKPNWYVSKLASKIDIFDKVINDPLLVAVMSGNDKNGNLTKQQSDLVLTQMTKNICDLPNDTDIPRFKEFAFTDGILLISCFDAQTFEWLTQANFDQVWFSGIARPISRLDCLVPIEVKTFVPGKFRPPEDILKMLSRQNPGLYARKYKVIAKRESFQGINMTLGLNMDLVTQLQELDMRPYYGKGRIKFQEKFATSTNVSPTKKMFAGNLLAVVEKCRNAKLLRTKILSSPHSNKSLEKSNYVNQSQYGEPSNQMHRSPLPNYNEKRYGDAEHQDNQYDHASSPQPCLEDREEFDSRSDHHSIQRPDDIPFAESTNDYVTSSRDDNDVTFPPSDYDIICEKRLSVEPEHPDLFQSDQRPSDGMDKSDLMKKLKKIHVPKHKWYIAKPRMKQNIFDQIMANPLLVAIIAGNNKQGNLTKEQCDLVIAKLTQNIYEVPKDEVTPRFNSFRFTDETLLIYCFDAETFAWVVRDNFDGLWPAGTARPVSRLDFLEPIKFSTFIPGHFKLSRNIFKLLSRQNPGFQTFKCIIWHKSNSSGGVNMTLGMNVDLKEQLQQLNMRPYYGVSRIKFNEKDSTNTKTSSKNKKWVQASQKTKIAAVKQSSQLINTAEKRMSAEAKVHLLKQPVFENRAMPSSESGSSKRKLPEGYDCPREKRMEEYLKGYQQLWKQQQIRKNPEPIIPNTLSANVQKPMALPTNPPPEHNSPKGFSQYFDSLKFDQSRSPSKMTSPAANRGVEQTNYFSPSQYSKPPNPIRYSPSPDYNEKRYRDPDHHDNQHYPAGSPEPCPRDREEYNTRSDYSHSLQRPDQIQFAQSPKSPNVCMTLSRSDNELQYPLSDYDIICARDEYADPYIEPEHPDLLHGYREQPQEHHDSRSSSRRLVYRKEVVRAVIDYVSRREDSRDREPSRFRDRSREYREHSRERHGRSRERHGRSRERHGRSRERHERSRERDFSRLQPSRSSF